jgi:hypothetical protein
MRMISGQPLDVNSPILNDALDLPRRHGASAGDRPLGAPAAPQAETGVRRRPSAIPSSPFH